MNNFNSVCEALNKVTNLAIDVDCKKKDFFVKLGDKLDDAAIKEKSCDIISSLKKLKDSVCLVLVYFDVLLNQVNNYQENTEKRNEVYQDKKATIKIKRNIFETDISKVKREGEQSKSNVNNKTISECDSPAKRFCLTVPKEDPDISAQETDDDGWLVSGIFNGNT